MNVINHLTSNNNKLSVHEFFKVCQNAGILRLVKTEEDENYIYIIICGVYRIQKNKKNGNISLWVYKLKDKNTGIWIRRNSFPCKIYLFWSNKAAHDMDDWLKYAITHIIKSLINAGYSIEDKIYLFRIGEEEKHDESIYISTLYPSSVYYSHHYEMHDIIHCLGKTASFNYPCDVQYISKHDLLEEIKNKIYHRVLKIIGVDNKFNASKALCKAIWIMVDKKIFAQYARASHCSIAYNSIRQSLFEDYLDFSKRIHILDDIDFCGLWPMVGLLRQQHKKGQFMLSGKTKELYERLCFPYELSYGEFRSLRHVSLSLVYALIYNHDNASFRLTVRLLRHPLIKNYPVRAIYWIIDYISIRAYPEKENDIYRICSKWLEYHRDLFKNIGFYDRNTESRQTSRWEMETNQLCHAIDWLLAEERLIHKNQEWPSFWRLSDEWTRQVKNNVIPATQKWKGTGINWQKIDNCVNELITFDALCQEGQEMEHCVASYADWCASGEYIAISVLMDNERATLGLSRKEHDLTYQFDQMRGIRNQAVSRNMLIKGRHILKIINSSLKG
ncbi:TPA: PcfJ domain-containing protein [Salmonella enterica]